MKYWKVPLEGGGAALMSVARHRAGKRNVELKAVLMLSARFCQLVIMVVVIVVSVVEGASVGWKT